MIFDRVLFLKGPCQFFEGAEDYMLIDADRKYIVTTGSVSIAPRKAVVSPVLYVELGGGVVKVRLAGGSSWITHECRKEATGVWWTIMQKDYFWEYVHSHQVPDWAHEVITKGVAKLGSESVS